ncbi:hypothetical protein EG68_12458 [Paragonimus skrjabini miyazakii]|uniref:Uncharacterized protein n=1 Tax=Paragonimus skrjabini miyazakii TaxID=59628 RepID=A0A8S9YGM9_9TREM|nr:hypothetical protein EG68_12458 [Paragonimus skrjabini miyazakii]
MPIRVSRHVARFLSEKIAVRLKLLETALLELHDIDNRLKMELLSLTSLVDADIENLDLDEDETDLFAPYTPQGADTVSHKRTSNFSPYELVDLDDVIVLNEWNEFDSDMFLGRAERYANIDGADNETLNLCTRSISASSGHELRLPGKASQTVNFLAGLINDSSLKMSQTVPYTTGGVDVTVPTCSKRPSNEHETDASPSKRKIS